MQTEIRTKAQDNNFWKTKTPLSETKSEGYKKPEENNADLYMRSIGNLGVGSSFLAGCDESKKTVSGKESSNQLVQTKNNSTRFDVEQKKEFEVRTRESQDLSKKHVVNSLAESRIPESYSDHKSQAVSQKNQHRSDSISDPSTDSSLPGTIQRKVRLGDANDEYEKEADKVAEKVMCSSVNPIDSTDDTKSLDSRIQRQCSACSSTSSFEEQEEKTELGIQRKSISNDTNKPDSNLAAQQVGIKQRPLESFNSQLSSRSEINIDSQSLTKGGLKLSTELRNFYEPRFGRNLSQVKIHSSQRSAKLCDNLNAHAFTYANHIWLGRNVSRLPSHVMAHEMAHVVQQTQPKYVTSNKRLVNTSATSLNERKVPAKLQRLPFWVPISKSGTLMTGTAIHKELLGSVKGKNKVEIEAPTPNAIRNAWGLGLQGFADLYRASSRVGVFFKPRQGLMSGDQTGSLRYTKPTKPSRAGRSPKPAAGKTGDISHIDKGPGNIELGELKPAALSELKKGNTQLGNYEKGFKDAAKLTNEWADNKGISKRWTLNSVTRLADSAFKVPAKFDPASGKSSERRLALADIDEVKSSKGKETVKYSVKKLFLPKPWLGQEIKGGLFMEPFGQGLWMYYARPTDFGQALDVPTFKRTEKQAYMTVAQQVQSEVIGNLKRGPERIKLKRKKGSKRPLVLQKENSIKIRRKRKKSKLKDEFEFKKWNDKRNSLGAKVRGKGASKKSKETKAIKKLQFIELAMEADKAITSKAKTKTKNLPKASALKEKVVTNTDGKKVTKKTSLDKLFGWLERWTSKPVAVLGKLREKFGPAFVKVANKLHGLKEKIKAKMAAVFKKKSAGRGKGYAKLALKAIGTALKQVGEIVIPHTVGLIMQAISRGASKKLEKEFNFSKEAFIEQAENDFPQAKALQLDVEKYVKSGEDYVKAITDGYATELEQVKDLVALGKTLAPIIEAAMVIANCLTPPGWGCLKLLAQSLIQDNVDLVLKSCYVRLRIAKKVNKVEFIKKMPEKLGQVALDKLKEIAPPKLKDVFAEKIVAETYADIKEDEILCIQLRIGLGGGKAVPTPGGKVGSKEGKKGIPPGDMQKRIAAAEAMTDLKNKLGEKGANDLADAMNKYGIPEGQGITAEQWKKLKGRLRSGDAQKIVQEFNNKKRKSGHKSGKPVDVDQFLKDVGGQVAKERGIEIESDITKKFVKSKTGAEPSEKQLKEIKQVLKESGWSVEKMKRIMEQLKTGKDIPVDEFIKQLKLLKKIPDAILDKSGLSVSAEQMKVLIKFLREAGWSDERLKEILALYKTDKKITFEELMKNLREIKRLIEKAKKDAAEKRKGSSKSRRQKSSGGFNPGGQVPLPSLGGIPDYCASPLVLCRRVWLDKDGKLLKIGPVEFGPQRMDKPGSLPGDKEQIEVPGIKIPLF